MRRYDRFRLFNDCKPMTLNVLYVQTEVDIGLTKERLRFAAESRLREARLFKANDHPLLVVNVNLVGAAFGISLKYQKIVIDIATKESTLATTWDSATAGTHGGRTDFVISNLSGLLDQFLTEYLRVNESACTESPQPPTQ